MKKTIKYETPTVTVHPQSFYLMGLDLGVSNAEVDDEAAKDRHDIEFEDKNWGKTDNSLW
ncbi:MAG: hypothetical protein K5778_10645 [Bacteroidaceae bacterium]|nr:hypothetical protein [Bacteroidaceae bacterium]